jgi:organic radical activating enzyme
MLPRLFSIFLDYLCNFECAHCSVGSSPRTKMPMPRELLFDVLAQIREIKTARVVTFTGGEATIHRDLLLEALANVSAGGYVSRLVTNGWWAKTPEKARRWVDDLKKVGLTELNTSYDDYHAPFCDIDNIVNLVRAALDADLRVGLGVIHDPKSKWSGDAVRQAVASSLGMTTDALTERIVVLTDQPTPSGTGEGIDVSDLDAKERLEVGCPEIVKTVSIHPNGLIKACCGHAMFYTPDLTIGNVLEEPLPVIVERSQHNLIYWWIHMYGPKRILDRLGVGGQYASICHACHVLLGEHRDALLEFVEDHKAEIYVNDVLFSDNAKRVANVLMRKKDEIIANVRRVNGKTHLPVTR